MKLSTACIPIAQMVLAALALLVQVSGHGYMFEPPSRNYYAHTAGLTYGSQAGVPMKEYCHHCLNGNGGVCGIVQGGDTNYDDWLDSQNNPMPWATQRTYEKGQIIEVHSHLASNHAGHMELFGCPDGIASTQDCFNRHAFEFVEDLAYSMPADPNYPERGYYWGGQQANGVDFAMRFRIPDNLVGEQVMLQWNYITANSCSPPGYSQYFNGANSLGKDLPDEFWSPAVSECTPPYPQDGSTGAGFPEHFFNCAEVAIGTDGPDHPSTPPDSTPTAPPQSTPTHPPPDSPTNPPQSAPIGGGGGEACCSQDFKTCATWCNESKDACENCANGLQVWLPEGPVQGSCLARWETCTNDQTACCSGSICRGDQWYMQCQHPDEGGVVVDPNPTDAPIVIADTPSPTDPQNNPPPTDTPQVITPSPSVDENDGVCGDDWASCFGNPAFCCEDHYCDISTVANNYAHCRPS